MAGSLIRSGFIFGMMLAPGGCFGQPPGSAPAASITLEPISLSRWQQKLASYRGQIVVVDFWATWCGPCLERFPHMVALASKYGREGRIRFVSMSLDDRDDRPALQRALDFLKRQNAAFENYRLDEIIPDAMEKLDLLGIPAVFIYDRRGELSYRLTGDNPDRQFTDADVEAAIRELLKADLVNR